MLASRSSVEDGETRKIRSSPCASETLNQSSASSGVRSGVMAPAPPAAARSRAKAVGTVVLDQVPVGHHHGRGAGARPPPRRRRRRRGSVRRAPAPGCRPAGSSRRPSSGRCRASRPRPGRRPASSPSPVRARIACQRGRRRRGSRRAGSRPGHRGPLARASAKTWPVWPRSKTSGCSRSQLRARTGRGPAELELGVGLGAEVGADRLAGLRAGAAGVEVEPR